MYLNLLNQTWYQEYAAVDHTKYIESVKANGMLPVYVVDECYELL
jgi:hypothetical protein